MTKKTYTVTAATGYDGHQFGETFEADLDEETEQRAIERGSIKAGKHKIAEEEDDG